MKLAPEGPMAIPLWVNGHAYMTVSETFFDVVDPRSGEAIRRIPLCGAAEATEAAAAARNALASWAALPVAERHAHLAALGDALAGYAGHFAKLLRQETGKSEAEAEAEVADAVAALRGAHPADGGVGVAAVVADAGRPLAAVAEAAGKLLAGGSTVVCKPSPKAPSVLFALCELSARAGWPAGVLNLLQGDEAAIDGLCATPAVDRLVYVGEAALGERVAAIAARHGKPFSTGA